LDPGARFKAWLVDVDVAAVIHRLSMVIVSGAPCRSMACSEKPRAAASSRWAVSKKSTVWPSLSTARYKYFHWLVRQQTSDRQSSAIATEPVAVLVTNGVAD
jgi:hypothetical protein